LAGLASAVCGAVVAGSCANASKLLSEIANAKILSARIVYPQMDFVDWSANR